jgi:glutamate dehydrogenase (NAD(P)+)
MAWAADTYINRAYNGDSRTTGMAIVTGKPVVFGGSQGREKATGQGLVFVLDELLPDMGIAYTQSTFSLIGFGNVGSWAARLLQERGATLVSVLDHTGAILNQRGIDAKKLTRHCEANGGISGFDQAEAISEEEFYRLPVDLMIPAALEQMIDETKAAMINCRVMVEGANAPTTPEGDQVLVNRGIEVLPAILCNSGGVTVSYSEWQQNRRSENWDLRQVDEQLRQHMSAAACRAKEAAARFGCNLRLACYCAAVEHISEVYRYRGIFP